MSTLTWEHPRVIPWLHLPQHQVENTPVPQKTSLRREKPHSNDIPNPQLCQREGMEGVTL